MKLNLGDRLIGHNQRTLIVAELSCNHLQDFELAVKTIRAMKESGADAVKVQTYRPDTLTIDCDKEWFQIQGGTLWDGQNLFQLYEKAYTPWDWQPRLQQLAADLGLLFFSSPFDPTAADFLEEMKVPCYKIASFEITDIPFIEYVARKGKPMIISTGIAVLADIQDAVTACRAQGNDQIVLLKCTSAYPTPMNEVNLRTMPNLGETFQVLYGLSDHTTGPAVPVAAVALGASIIEKHFILARDLGGPDAAFSMEPAAFKQMADLVRQAEAALGTVVYDLTAKMQSGRAFARSLFVVRDMPAGDVFSPDNVRSIRPGNGLLPKHLPAIIGKRARIDIPFGTPLQWNLVAD